MNDKKFNVDLKDCPLPVLEAIRKEHAETSGSGFSPSLTLRNAKLWINELHAARGVLLREIDRFEAEHKGTAWLTVEQLESWRSRLTQHHMCQRIVLGGSAHCDCGAERIRTEIEAKLKEANGE